MIERQILAGEYVATVLTGVVVTAVDVGARERHMLAPPALPHKPEQADHGWQLERERHCSYFYVVLGDNLNLALTPERNRPLPIHDLERFVRGVQNECHLHKTIRNMVGEEGIEPP